MTLSEFHGLIRTESPRALAHSFVFAEEIIALSRDQYAQFKIDVGRELGSAEHVAVVGSGNWRYSLNPDKAFRAFSDGSDIDVAVISREQFYRLWETMRSFHRDRYYLLTRGEQERLRRNGENVYSGFVSPFWLPDAKAEVRFEYKRKLNALGGALVGYRPVKVLIFKNGDEAVDYYTRGFEFARRRLA